MLCRQCAQVAHPEPGLHICGILHKVIHVHVHTICQLLGHHDLHIDEFSFLCSSLHFVAERAWDAVDAAPQLSAALSPVRTAGSAWEERGAAATGLHRMHGLCAGGRCCKRE